MAGAAGERMAASGVVVRKLKYSLEGRQGTINPKHPCAMDLVESMIDLLVHSDDTFDSFLDSSVLEEYQKERPWVEVVFDQEIDILVGFMNQKVAVKKILVFFRNKGTGLILYGNPEYLEYNMAANKKGSPSFYPALQSCLKPQ
jgi:hypothetical protein